MGRVSDALSRAAKEGGRVIGEFTTERETRIPEDPADDINRKVQTTSVNAGGKEDVPDSSGLRRDIQKLDLESRDGIWNDESLPNTIPEGSSNSLSKGFHDWSNRSFDGRDARQAEEYPLVALDKNSPAGEQYKILREQIKKMSSHASYRSIAITSPIKGDGKTTVSANLAAAMALYYEQQVLLVDADLRSPSVHRFFGVSASPGLGEYLSSNGDVDFLSCVQNTSLPGLQVLSAGKATSFHSELLGSDRMRALLEEISVKLPTHQIILDTSPVLSTPDPLVLSQQVDGIVMVVRAGKTPRDCLLEAIKSLGADRIMGLVLNAAELGPASKYYYYYRQQS